MYIVVIGWLYVILMMAITERSIVAGAMTFIFYGLLPCALLLWLTGAHRRLLAARQRHRSTHQHVHEPDREDAGRD